MKCRKFKKILPLLLACIFILAPTTAFASSFNSQFGAKVIIPETDDNDNGTSNNYVTVQYPDTDTVLEMILRRAPREEDKDQEFDYKTRETALANDDPATQAFIMRTVDAICNPNAANLATVQTMTNESPESAIIKNLNPRTIDNIDDGKLWIDLYGSQKGLSYASRTMLKNTFVSYAEAFRVPYNSFANSEIEIGSSEMAAQVLTWDKGYDAGRRNPHAGILKEMLSMMGDLTSSGGISIRSYMVTTGFILAIVFALAQLFDTITARNFSPEEFYRQFLTMMLGLVIIANSSYIAAAVIRVACSVNEMFLRSSIKSSIPNTAYCQEALLLTISETLSTLPEGFESAQTWFGSGFGTMVLNGLKSAGAVFSNNDLLKALFDSLGDSLYSLISGMTIYAIAIEAGVRYLFSPIAIADLFSERFRSQGWMWLKKLFATIFTGAIILAILWAKEVIKTALGGGYESVGWMAEVIINFTVIGMFAKARGIADEIIGAR